MTSRLIECLDEKGRSPFADWFVDLDPQAAARVVVALRRLEGGNRSALKPVGEGVSECRLDFGPGYRIYLGQDGETLIVLLGGGTKRRQQADIDAAKALWRIYKLGRKDR